MQVLGVLVETPIIDKKSVALGLASSVTLHCESIFYACSFPFASHPTRLGGSYWCRYDAGCGDVDDLLHFASARS